MDTQWQSTPTRSTGTAAIVLGCLLMIGGVLALTVSFWATLAAVVVIGAFLVGAAVLEIVGAFTQHHRRSRIAALVTGILSAVVGVWLVMQPALGAATLTVLLAFYFLISGGMRVVAAIRRGGERGRGWAIASGIAAIVLGAITLASFPLSSLWLIGTLVGIDFIFIGASLIATGTAMRAIPMQPIARAIPSQPRKAPERGYDERQPPAP